MKTPIDLERLRRWWNCRMRFDHDWILNAELEKDGKRLMYSTCGVCKTRIDHIDGCPSIVADMVLAHNKNGPNRRKRAVHVDQ